MKVLLVTFPNDLGSRTIEKNLERFLSIGCDLKLFRFAAQDSGRIDEKVDNRRNLLRRFQDAIKLRSAVRNAVREGRKVLFYNLSPALYAFGSWRGGQIYVTMDWARRLFKDPMKSDRDPIIVIHKMVLRACSGVLPMTEAMAVCLRDRYNVPPDKVHRVPSLFDVEYFDPGEITMTDRIRLLYVGGEVKRKGGDLLYDAFCSRLKDSCTLTMVTNTDFPPCEGFTLRKGVRYGTPEHLALMRGHDVFVLPTRQDAGPQVIGEAAAAGLAVLTTRQALGAPHVVCHGVTGFISDSAEACIEDLVRLVGDPERIRRMRCASLDHMRTYYAKELIAAAYLEPMRG